MGLCNLRRIGEDIAARKAVHEAYMEQLSGLPIGLTAEQPGVESNYAYFPAVFESRKTRDAVCEALAEAGVYARKYFYPLITDFECYRGRPGFDSAATPVAAQLAATVLTLPLYPELTDDEVRRVCAAIREALA
jgi:dTDP-4-amino-4,6-dideoxygalactose transaminase